MWEFLLNRVRKTLTVKPGANHIAKQALMSTSTLINIHEVSNRLSTDVLIERGKAGITSTVQNSAEKQTWHFGIIEDGPLTVCNCYQELCQFFICRTRSM
eukprot:CFRG4647T1